MKICPKNWSEFQHYKDRNPTWIKLHKKLLDDYEFQRLPLSSRALAPMLWLVASEAPNATFDANPDLIAFRIRWTVKEIEEALSPLINAGFFTVAQDDSKPIANTEHDAIPETYKPEKETTTSASPPLPLRRPKVDPQETEGFKAFWASWPKSDRKTDRFKCFEHWRKFDLESLTRDIVAHVEIARCSRKWMDGYEPSPLRYLRGKCWRDEMEAAGEMAQRLAI